VRYGRLDATRPAALAAAAALLVLAAMPAVAASTATRKATRPAATTPPSVGACPWGHAFDATGGLDGQGGCHALARPEPPGELLAKAAAADATHHLDTADRYQAGVAWSRQLLSSARGRPLAGARSFTTTDGTAVTGSASAWRPAFDGTINVDDPQYDPSQLGWDRVAGRVTALAVDPTDHTADTVYLSSANGGLWKTRDGGSSWRSIGADIPTSAFGAVAVAADGTVWAGTGEGNTNTDGYAGAGVWRSVDRGATFQRVVGVPNGLIVPHLEVAGRYVYVATNNGLFGSVDGGPLARLALPTGTTKALGTFVTDVRVKPGTEQAAGGPEVTAAVGWRSGGVPGAGLYRSTGGGPFTALTGTGFGKGDSTAQSSDPIGRISLAYATGPTQNHDILWAVVQDPGRLNNDLTPIAGTPKKPAGPSGATVFPTNLNGVYRSGDDGATWTLKGSYESFEAAPGSALVALGTALSGPGVQAWYNQYVVVDPLNSNHVVVGLEEIYQTLAGDAPGVPQWQTIGRYWNNCGGLVATQVAECPPYQRAFGDPTTHPDQHAATAAVVGGRARWYVGNDGGAYRQTADPNTGLANGEWTSLNRGLLISQPYQAVMGGDGTVYAGLQDNGTTKTTSTGRTDMVFGGDGFRVAVDPDNSDNAYEEYATGQMRSTKNGGRTWATIYPTSATRQRFDTPFVLDGSDKNHIVYGAGEIWESKVGISTTSSSWTKVFDTGNPNAVTALGTSGPVSYAAFCGQCNITTADGDYNLNQFTGGIATNAKTGCTAAKASTACWHVAAATGLPKQLVTGLAIDPEDSMTVYATVASYSRRWTLAPTGMSPGHLFVSHDAGQTFTDASGNLPDVLAAAVLVTADTVIVGTDTGVFAAPKDSTEFVPFGLGLPVVPASSLGLNPQGDTLVLATHGRGIWLLPFGQDAHPSVPEAPLSVALPLLALLALAVTVALHRYRSSVAPAPPTIGL
jgi:hypothetical protein